MSERLQMIPNPEFGPVAAFLGAVLIGTPIVLVLTWLVYRR